jgi:hypothetical protein
MGIANDKKTVLNARLGTPDQTVLHDNLYALERSISRLAGYGAFAIVLLSIAVGVIILL